MKHPFSPKDRINQVREADLQAKLRQIFTKWGLPKAMKFDNGKPFGDPQRNTVSLLTMWLVGLGIRVIFNRPRVPQDNAKVERCQGVTKRWADFDQCDQYEQLQNNLDAAVLTQREQYPVTRLHNKTRLEVFPSIANQCQKRANPYCPMLFDLDRVYQYLARGTWQRKVSARRQVAFFGIRYTIEKKFKHQILDFRMDVQEKSWKAYDSNGALALTIKNPISVGKICHINDVNELNELI